MTARIGFKKNGLPLDAAAKLPEKRTPAHKVKYGGVWAKALQCAEQKRDGTQCSMPKGHGQYGAFCKFHAKRNEGKNDGQR